LASNVLETVIPQVGGAVLVVQGAHRLKLGSLIRLNVEKFSADVQIDGNLIELPYESICKFKSEK
jgi:hypothetical protein